MTAVAVIDDEPLVCELISDSLTEQGLELHCAGTAKAGAAMLRAGSFTLALIDVVLPDATGLALAEVAIEENTAVLLMSGHPNATDCLTQCGLPHLAKPFRLSVLQAETAKVMADTERNVAAVRDGLRQLNDNLDGLTSALGVSRRLLESSRRLLAKPDGG